MTTISIRRPIIAVLGDTLYDGYEGPIWSGLSATAESLDVNLLSFAGSLLDSWYKYKTYNLINKEQVDGVIVFSSTIVGTYSKDKIAEFLRMFSPLPIICISQPVEGLPYVAINNQLGMKQLVDHLIEVHHHSRIAFIKGPADHGEANDRFEGYLESLVEHNIQLDPQLVYPGNFTWTCGTKAIQCLIDERKATFDAVIASSDYVALYAMSELQRRGFNVPEDIAVGGFDDIREATIATPAISTVRQPLESIGREALTRIISCIRGESPDASPLPTTLVIRRSCGCISENHQQRQAKISMKPVDEGGPNPPISVRLEKIFPNIGGKVGNNAWSTELFESFSAAWAGSSEIFLSKLEDLIVKGKENSLSISQWYKVLQTIFQMSRQNYHGDWERYVDLVEDSYEFIGTLSLKAQIVEQAQIEDLNKSFQRIQRQINSSLEIDPINRQILEHLAQLGVESFFLSRYVREDQEQAELFCHYNRNKNLQVDVEMIQYPPRDLYPGHFLPGSKRYSFMIWPIMDCGFAVCDVLCLEGSVRKTETVSRIGETVRSVFLINIVKKYTEELEKKVEERTRELTAAQKQVIEVAHQAGMAEMSIGVMHNIGNLLNSVGVSAEIMRQTLDHFNINGLVKANSLLSSHHDNLANFFSNDEKASLLPVYYKAIGDDLSVDHAKLSGEMEQLTEHITLIREIINDLQDYARGGESGILEESIGFEEIIESALKLQESHINDNHICIVKEYASIRPFPIQKAKFIHILVNLIKNAIEALEQIPVNNRRLSIRLYQDRKGQVNIDVSDTGTGIDPNDLTKIFSFGFTTKPHGHGFGLHACANYMREMGGSITVDSLGQGKGATFTLIILIK